MKETGTPLSDDNNYVECIKFLHSFFRERRNIALYILESGLTRPIDYSTKPRKESIERIS